MNFDISAFVLDNLEAAGAIGGYVSISIIGFSLISFASKKRSNNVVTRIGPKRIHPIIGSFLGAIPGCGGTIVVASLYKNKKISFGGLVASFISTLGEGSFVLLGASNEANVLGNLKAYFVITIFGLIAGVFFGYLLDFLGFKTISEHDDKEHLSDLHFQNKKNSVLDVFIEKLGFYAIIVMAIFLAPGSIIALWGGEIDIISELTYWFSVGLTVMCIVYYLISRSINYHHCSSDNNTLKKMAIHAILDVAMVVTYVFIGLFFANYIIDVIVGPTTFDSWMTASAHIVILLAALIGVTPGCGGMIAVAVAFITIPNFPMAALIAAAIATSGDGIFPLLAENRKEGFYVSIIGLFIALVVGYTALWLGF